MDENAQGLEEQSQTEGNMDVEDFFSEAGDGEPVDGAAEEEDAADVDEVEEEDDSFYDLGDTSPEDIQQERKFLESEVAEGQQKLAELDQAVEGDPWANFEDARRSVLEDKGQLTEIEKAHNEEYDAIHGR